MRDALDRLPAGLPPGRVVIPDPQYADGDPVTDPVLWVSDRPVPDAGALWARLLGEHPRTGLWSLLLTGPQDLGRVLSLAVYHQRAEQLRPQL